MHQTLLWRRCLGAPRAWIDHRAQELAKVKLPRWAGIAASALIILSSIVYGTIRGGHVSAVFDWLKNGRDMAANAAGFNVSGVTLAGHKHLSREEILAIAGVTGRTSLMFLDVADTRARLKANPWIADATVQKLYPDRLQITVIERAPFALWQKGWRVGVIAVDGTLLESYISPRYAGLPFVVGAGAEMRAKVFLDLLDRYPAIRNNVRACVLVAERRWNLKLKNGLDVRLPEFGIERALDQLVALDREKKLMTRDISAIDLRLPDRITVRLSQAAAQAREDALKAKKLKPKGGNA